MPATSASQQRLFGMIHAYQQGKLKHPPKKIKETAEHISKSDAKDFAATSHEGLPERVEKSAQFLGGVVKYAIEHRLSAEEATLLVKYSGDQYCLERFGVTLLGEQGQKSAAMQQLPGLPKLHEMGQTPHPFTQGPEQTGEPNYSQNQPMANPPAIKHGPTGPYDFVNHPDIHLMITRQKDLIKKKQTEMQAAQKHSVV